MTASLPKSSNILIVRPDQNPLMMEHCSSPKKWKTSTAGIIDAKQETPHPSLFGHELSINSATHVSDSTNRSNRTLKFFIAPEDTTQKVGGRQPKIATYQRLNIFGIIKTTLWIAISIGLSLMIGNLC